MGEAATLDVASPVKEPDELEKSAPAEPVDQPSDDDLARRANGSLMVRWSQETRAMLVMEFIAARHLFAELNEFLKRKIR